MTGPDPLTHQMEAARAHVDAQWSEGRASWVEAEMLRRRARRVAVKRTGAAVAALLACVVGVRLWPSERATIEPVAQATVVERSAIGARLVSGAAWFEVKVDHAHPYRVWVDDVEVEVLGTRFLVERAGEAVHVVVDHGTVRVRSAAGEAVLRAGDAGSFALRTPVLAPQPRPEPAAPEPASAPEPVKPAPHPAPHAAAPRPAPPKPSVPQGWRELANDGDYDAAWARLQETHEPVDQVADLLLSADVARLSRHPEAAVAPLRRCLAAHPEDPRAPLAAFTLGRVLLDDLGRPRDAVEAFTRAHDLAPDGPLAADALARQVESWARAGEAVEAHAVALDYLRRYPTGRRAAAVRLHGGVRE